MNAVDSFATIWWFRRRSSCAGATPAGWTAGALPWGDGHSWSADRPLCWKVGPSARSPHGSRKREFRRSFWKTLVHEPEVADVDRVTGRLREIGLRAGDFVLAVGGGAAIDLGKAIAAMATEDQSPTVKDYLEGVGRDLKLLRDPLPVFAMPTTSGTGAEATRNAVISSYDPPFKKSLRSEKILPRIAWIDPQLTVSVPPAVTAASGMDAITQLLESFISRKAQPIPQALCVEGLRRASRRLPRPWRIPNRGRPGRPWRTPRRSPGLP